MEEFISIHVSEFFFVLISNSTGASVGGAALLIVTCILVIEKIDKNPKRMSKYRIARKVKVHAESE